MKPESQLALTEAVWTALRLDLPPRNPSDCELRCYRLPKGATRHECLQECKEQAAVAVVAAQLHRDLFTTMAEIIWGGGDIDPLPMEQAVRARFAEGGRPRAAMSGSVQKMATQRSRKN